MKLIIAEKPSLGKNIMAAIGAGKFNRQDGYFESPDYIVTWAFGHLFGLLDIEEYQPGYDPEEKKAWTLEGLPYRPHEFKFNLRKDPKTRTVDSGVRKQFGVIKKLCSRSDVECVINAGDSDREGEIIIRIILDQAGNTKPVKRLWMPDQTPQTINAGLQELKDDAEYDALANEGYARTYIDWLYGINLTRLATLKSGTMLRVGRVIVPIVKVIYDRDMAIRNFKPQKYWGLVSKAETNGEVIELTSKKKFEYAQKSLAESQCETYNLAGATVKDVKVEEATIKPGKLYSLSKLQGVLGKKFKMSPTKSLEIVQKLYDAGYVTYPRTNSEYLATAERGKINTILDKLKAEGYKVVAKDVKKTIYDESKIESHSALTPTGKLAKKEDLSKEEWDVYSTILNRFLAVFCSEDCKVNRTVITIEINRGLETFKLKGDVFISKGWMQYDDTGRSDKILPKLSVGDNVNLAFKPVEKETTPPKHYTVDTLNKFLKNPFKDQVAEETPGDDADADAESPEVIAESDDQEYQAIFEGVEIGTEATRSSIIQNAIDSSYISLKNNTYTILPGGEFLIETLHKLGIEMEKEKTAELGRVLKKVYRGEIDVENSVTLAYQEVRCAFTASAGVSIDKADLPAAVTGAVGKCPKCGSDVVERDKVFGCSNKDCKFGIWKDSKRFASIGMKVNAKLVKALLTGKRVLVKNCKSAKTGKLFDCYIIPDFSGEYPDFKMEFPSAEDLSIGKCPKCGADVVERNQLFGCSNKECRFAIWKEDKFFAGIGKKVTASVVKSLLSKKKVDLKNCTSKKTGKQYDCIVTVDFSGQYPKYEMSFDNPKKKK